MEAVYSSGISLSTYNNERCYNAEDYNWQRNEFFTDIFFILSSLTLLIYSNLRVSFFVKIKVSLS